MGAVGKPSGLVLLLAARAGERVVEFLASWRVHAVAFRTRVMDASVTRRLNRGSVARVRKTSSEIL